MKKFIYALASVAMLGCMSANAIDWTEEGLNIAMGKTSWCSTGDAKAGNDGNVGSRWESQHFAPQWWAVDLGEEKDLDRIEIKWEGAYASEWAIYVLQDAPKFTEVSEAVTDPAGEVKTFNKLDAGQLGTPIATSEQYPVTDLYTTISGLENVKARYLLIDCTKRALPYGISFWEFYVSEKIADANVVAKISVGDMKVKKDVPFSFKVASLNRVGAPVAENVTGATFTTSDPSLNIAANGANGYTLTATKYGKYSFETSAVIDGNTFTATSNVEVGPDWENLRNLADVNKNGLAKAYASHNPTQAYLSNDGNIGTRWVGSTDPCWWFVDLGNTYKITLTEAEFEAAGAKVYEVYTATTANVVKNDEDGTETIEPVWGETPVARVEGLPSQNHLIDTQVINGVSARYVKFSFLEPSLGYPVSPWELRVAGEPDHAEVPGSVQLTASATEIPASESVTFTAKVLGDYGTEIEAPVTYELSNNTSGAEITEEGVLTTTKKGSVDVVGKSGNIVSDPITVTTVAAGEDLALTSKGATAVANGETDASTLIDGNDGSLFIFTEGGANEQDHNVVIDLHRLVDIDMVRVHMEGASSSNYTIDFSKDGENYTSVYSYEGPDAIDGYTHNHYGKDGKATRYVRLHSKRNGTGYGLKIYEIGVFGETYLTKDGNTFTGKWDADDFDNQVTVTDGYVDLTAVTGLPATKPEVENNPNLLLVVGDDCAFKGASNVVVKDTEGNYSATLIDLYNTSNFVPSIKVQAAKINVHVNFDKENVYAEAYLPFVYTAPADTELYQFNGVDPDGNVYLTDVATSFAASVPFLVKLNTNMNVLSAENVALDPVLPTNAAAAPDITPVALIGTYSKYSTDRGSVYKVKDGELRELLSEESILPFGAFTTINGVTRDYKILPAIGSVDTIVSGETAVDVYTLDGVKIKSGVAVKDAAKGLSTGIYVIGGKKVLVRK